MLDLVFLVVIVLITAIALLYAAGCDALLRADPTRDEGEPRGV